MKRMTLLVALAAIAAGPAQAQADFGFQPGSFAARAHDPAGAELTQAGAHPDATAEFLLNETIDERGRLVPDESAKDIRVELPPGFVGNPQATPQCRHRDFQVNECPRLAMVGAETFRYAPFPGTPPNTNVVPVYNLVPPEGVVAQFGFQIATVSVVITARVNAEGGYNLVTDISDLSQALLLYGSSLTFWGVPADMNGPGPKSFLGGITYGAPSGAPRRPFLTNPTLCGPPPPSAISARSWQHPDRWVTTDPYRPSSGPTGCDRLRFEPAIDVTPSTTRPDTPAGYTVELRIPQNDDADGLATPTLRDAVVTLPEGVSLSPAASAGLEGCADDRLLLGSSAPPSCPDASRIGSVSVATPLLADPLEGAIHLRPQHGRDPASGEMFRIAIVLESEERGLRVKLPGQVRINPVTGRIETTFANNPQLPFSAMTLRFHGGSRAPLVNPPDCGTKTAQAALTAWSGATVATSDAFAIDCPGVAGFAPAFSAGTTVPAGGAFTGFALRVDRPDGQQYVDGIALELPRGLLAKIRDVPLCPEPQAAAGTCGAESRVGTATVGAGAGATPFFLRGSVSLGGPYRGAPYSLSVAVPALAGPFDLGLVVVRQAIHVDPVDAHLTVVSDPLPTIVGGVPLRLRSPAVDIDRPGFMVNPNSCAEQRVGGTLHAADGSASAMSARFQVGDCAALRLAPRMKLALRGRGRFRDGQHPGLRATVTQSAGQTSLRSVAVTLPKSLALDPDNANALCEYDAGQRVDCPKSSIVGRAKAVSPLLSRPLTGPVYFVKGVRFNRRTGARIRTLPTLLIPLRGEIALDVRARSSVRGGQLVTTFPAIPDAPLSRFELSLAGGRSGILVANTAVCKARRIVRVVMRGHNGRRSDRGHKLARRC